MSILEGQEGSKGIRHLFVAPRRTIPHWSMTINLAKASALLSKGEKQKRPQRPAHLPCPNLIIRAMCMSCYQDGISISFSQRRAEITKARCRVLVFSGGFSASTWKETGVEPERYRWGLEEESRRGCWLEQLLVPTPAQWQLAREKRRATSILFPCKEPKLLLIPSHNNFQPHPRCSRHWFAKSQSGTDFI